VKAIIEQIMFRLTVNADKEDLIDLRCLLNPTCLNCPDVVKNYRGCGCDPKFKEGSALRIVNLTNMIDVALGVVPPRVEGISSDKCEPHSLI